MTTQFFSQNGRLVVVSVLVSLVLSVWCLWADPVVNNDGVYYFRAARELLHGNWQGAVNIFSWLPYPGLIAAVQTLPGVGEQAAAQILSAFFYCVLIVGFLAVVYELGADRKTLIVAAVLILFFPTLNKYRSFVIRDVAYLAFYVWSLVFLFRYWMTKNRKALWWWVLLTLGSVLFRVEGLALLIVVPLALMTLQGLDTKFRWLLIASYSVSVLLLAIVLVAWVNRNYIILGEDSGSIDIMLFMSQAADSLFVNVGEKLRILRTEFSANHYKALYVVAMVFLALAEIVRRLSVIFAILPIYAIVHKRIFPKPDTRALWLVIIFINSLVLVGSGIVISLVVDRYAVATALTILLVVPFVLVHLHDLWKHHSATRRGILWMFPVITLICGWLFIKGLDVFTEKEYIVEAGQWISENVEPNAEFYSNNLLLIYYTGRDDYHENDSYSWRQTHWLIKYDKWKDYDYIALQISKQDEATIEWLYRHFERNPVKTFMNKKGDQVLVYHTANS